MAVAHPPLDDKVATRQAHLDLAAGKLAPRRGDAGRARGRAASTRQPRAPLPGAELEMRRAEHLDERDIGALGKERMTFEARSDPDEVVSTHISDEEQAVWIADIDHRRQTERRILDRFERDRVRIVEGLGERDLVPGEAGRAHVDGDAAVVIIDGCADHPALGLDADTWHTALIGEK